MKLRFLILSLLFFGQSAFAQTDLYNSLYKKGDEFVVKNDYISAFIYYDKAGEKSINSQQKIKAKKQKEFCQEKIRQQQNELRRQLKIATKAIKRAEKAEKEKEETDRQLAALKEKNSEDEKTVITNDENTDNLNIVLSTVRTPDTNKTIKDFKIPTSMFEEDKELVSLIMQSESMKDEDRQYWFDLSKAMNLEQIEKLRKILLKERRKLAEIDAKYAITDELKVGIRLFDNKEYDKALTHLLKIKDDNSSGVLLNNYLARLYAIKNNFSQAEKYVQEIKGSKYISEGYRNIGDEFYNLKNYRDALKSHLNAITYDETNSRSFYAAGVNYYLLNQLEKAKEYFEKASIAQQEKIRVNINNTNLYFGLSWYKLFANKPQEAIIAAKKSLELFPDDYGVNTNLVLGYLLNDEFEKAKEIYLTYKDKLYIDNNTTWKEVFLNDIKDLEKVGIIHKDFARVKQLLNE